MSMRKIKRESARCKVQSANVKYSGWFYLILLAYGLLFFGGVLLIGGCFHQSSGGNTPARELGAVQKRFGGGKAAGLDGSGDGGGGVSGRLAELFPDAGQCGDSSGAGDSSGGRLLSGTDALAENVRGWLYIVPGNGSGDDGVYQGRVLRQEDGQQEPGVRGQKPDGRVIKAVAVSAITSAVVTIVGLFLIWRNNKDTMSDVAGQTDRAVNSVFAALDINKDGHVNMDDIKAGRDKLLRKGGGNEVT